MYDDSVIKYDLTKDPTFSTNVQVLVLSLDMLDIKPLEFRDFILPSHRPPYLRHLYFLFQKAEIHMSTYMGSIRHLFFEPHIYSCGVF